ncbi:hypothetical protein J5N97_017048 [Dioscorea zingiberensis]|uniref:Reverse transcriptase n=1 Tax=Dioscorea zingiberensis TaxID=325984 RepID=A0A9D5CMI0_9LILI|nr:hypothetical protein J5N97_017048 [Dioscorea zingiberensis]
MVTPIANSRYSLHLVFSTEKPKHWVLSVIYNSQNIHLQKVLWRDLTGISTLNLPWILTGDFNAILTNEEHRGRGFDHYSIKSKIFNEFVIANHLQDFGFYGSPYTWCNNQQGLARRWARLDRFLANSDWLNNFDSYITKHLPRTASDHSPLFLNAKFFCQPKYKVFRFENYWFDYEKCHQNVYKAWSCSTNGSPMHAFNHHISKTRDYLAKWKAKGISSLDRDIGKTKEEITHLESLEASSIFFNLSSLVLRGLYSKHSALLRQNAIKWAQRARLMWLRNGDYNTSFFHKQARARNHRNKISAITDDQGNLQTDHQNIAKAFTEFYAKLWTTYSNTSIEDLIVSMPNDLPALTDRYNEILTRPVTPLEIYQTLKSMPKGKSPGPDGFNVEFYLYYWEIVKDSLLSAVSHFFQTTSLPNAWAELSLS